MRAPAQAGETVKGKYRIDRILGEGGMGVVVLAHHVALDQPVAIKFLRPEMLRHPEIVERFAREARAASKIKSDHVARVMDVDALDDGTPFIVIEYLEGTDLSSVRKSRKTLPVHVAVGYVLEACEAIGEAHRLGIVHRDIKPANLFLANRGDGRTRVKVLDFGISKLGGGEGTGGGGMTSTAAVMGSPDYMAPEQMLSMRNVDARADIWALGVSLYELLTGRMPFTGETVTSIYAAIMRAAPISPSVLRPDVPAGLAAVVSKCLAPDRENRYASVAELVAALEAYSVPIAAGALAATVAAPVFGPASAPEVPSPAPVTIVMEGSPSLGEAERVSGVMTALDMAELEARPRRSTRPFAIGAVVVIAVAAAAIFVATRPRSVDAPAASAVATAAMPAPEPRPSALAPVVAVSAAASVSAAPVAPTSKPASQPKPVAQPRPAVAAPAATLAPKKSLTLE